MRKDIPALEGQVYGRLLQAARRCPPHLVIDEKGEEIKVIVSGAPHKCAFCGERASSFVYFRSAGVNEAPGLLVCDAKDCRDKVKAMSQADWDEILREGKQFWRRARGATR